MSDTVLRRRASDRPNITSLQSHILAGEASSPGSDGRFHLDPVGVVLAAKAIAHKVRSRASKTCSAITARRTSTVKRSRSWTSSPTTSS
jgi:hypothetical protein